jgi:phosphate starvation-inducible PhoH-like protein
MTSNKHTDEVFKAKRRPKGEIRFQVSLNEEQKKAKAIILKNVITVVKGKAGSGKSLLSAQIALDMLFKREIEKVIITRPLITSGEEVGTLPGGINDKLMPYTAPVYDNMYRLYGKEKIDELVLEGKIEIIPLGFFRGRNLADCLLVVDEAQNITSAGFELILTRICHGTKVIICGDSGQIDLRDKKQSGFEFLCHNMTRIDGFGVVSLETNHRHPIIEEIVKIYAMYR